MSIEQQINQVRHSLRMVEALLLQAEETLKGCQQTQQTRLELAAAQIEYRLVTNAIKTLEDTSKSQEMTVKAKQNYIEKLNKRSSTLREDIAELIREKVSTHRGLRALGNMWGNRRQLGLPRQRGRIIGVAAAAGGAPPTECESACGLTHRSGPTMPGTLTQIKTLCGLDYASGALITSVTLNLAAVGSVVIMAALVTANVIDGNITIERPSGTTITDQAAQQSFAKSTTCGDTYPMLVHRCACETLPAGNYIWELRVRLLEKRIFAYWMKAREITCLPV